ncbi:MAG: hypothetical protein EP329_21215 [Deltaproteobacteria bacterium]|nr:MAG: hypothetical protein EP329_21215 [Deltaproteobacteria bacterium]
MYRSPFAYGLVVLLNVAACSSSGGAEDGADTVLVDDVVADTASDTAPDDTAATSASGPLAACDGPAKIYVETEVGERELVDWRGGDTVLRGYATCDGDVDRFRLVATCGGSLTARLTWANADSQLAVTLRADEVDGGTLSDGPATVTLPLAVLDDADESGDYALDLDVSCVSGEATPWQLDLDTASTERLPKAANGWPEDLLPGGWNSCEDGRFPYFGPVRDQYGHADVTAGQFYGDMTVYAVSGAWCTPCQEAAAEARELHDRLEAKGADWGFTLVELLIEDANGRPSFGPEAPAWAEAFDLTEPVLVGASLHGINQASCIDATGIPTIVVVDPLGKIRRVIQGAATLANLEFTLENDWRLFRYEHPEWVSPRCAGVAGAERLCPCDDVDGHGDADGDFVSDACDVCAAGDDREDHDGDGVPNACDDSPGESPIPQHREFEFIQARFLGTLDEAGAIVGSASIGLSFYDTSRIKLCGVTRTVTEATRLPDEAGDDVMLGLKLPATDLDFGGSLSCYGLLDPELWGSGLSADLGRLPSGFTFDDRCPVDGCAGQDDPVFAFVEENLGCDEDWSVCAGRLLGASVWTERDGVLRGPGGASYGIVRAFELDDAGAPKLDTPIDAATLRAGLPAAYYVIDVFVPGSEAERLTGDL